MKISEKINMDITGLSKYGPITMVAFWNSVNIRRILQIVGEVYGSSEENHGGII